MSEILKTVPRESYIKYLARDFALATFQIWYRGEARDPQPWTPNELPHKPYLVFHRVGNVVTAYYGETGVAWLIEEIKQRTKQEEGFVTKITDGYLSRFRKLKDIIEAAPALSLSELKKYVDHIQDAWPWFNAVWYALDTFDSMPEYAKELEFLIGVRKETEHLVPATETILRKSILAAYPHVGQYADSVLLEEAFENRVPDMGTLIARHVGFYFTDDRLLPNTPESKREIEEQFNIVINEPVAPKDATIIKGTVASKGKVTGRVRRIYGTKQIPDFKKGEILVAASTIPDFLPALKKAAAIVSDEGGAVCHAAITARELRTPCVIGTQHAMDILKDGDLVEVDAEKGVVRILERA